LGLLILTGCLGFKAQPDPSHFYVLGVGAAATTSDPVDCKKILRLVPVTLAGHLNNSKIALRRGENEIDYMAWDFWAEPLIRALPREFIASLGRAMPDTCVFSYRRASATATSVQLEMLVEQFEMTDNGEVVASVSWAVTSDDGKSRRQGSTKVTRAYEKGTDGVVSGVQALTGALNEIAQKIAKEIQ
jgi:uncharacterized lipoprotein YmbA